MSPRPLFLAALACAAAMATATAQAAGTVFDFEGLPLITETPFSITAGGLTALFSGPTDVDPGAFAITSNFPSPTGTTYRTMSGDFLSVGSAFGATGAALTIAFSAPITSFSLAFALDEPAHTTTLAFATNAGGSGTSGGTLTSGYRYPEGTLSYTGTAFTQLVLNSTAIDFSIDNLAATAAVPEPATYALLAGGIGLLAWTRRARRGDGARP